MSSTSRLYFPLWQLLRQQVSCCDIRHLNTLAWMVVGLMASGSIALTAWGVYVHTCATQAQSHQRRWQRWLTNSRIDPQQLYAPLITLALRSWGTHTLYLALDTSMLFDKYCLIHVAVLYRGRAIPLRWKVMVHGSSSVALADYQALLTAIAPLLPPDVKVVLLADRGFADLDLLAVLKQLHWQYRIRIKSNFWVELPGRGCQLVGSFSLKAGQAIFLHQVRLGRKGYGPVSLALGRHSANQELWYILTDERPTLETFWEYGQRFWIEEGFLDEKSNGFQLESSRLRDALALERLFLVIAVATLYLTTQGTQVVASGRRKWVDPHWQRGMSYLKIGWNWVRMSLTQGWKFTIHLALSGQPDPQPAISSKRQFRERLEQPEFNSITSYGNPA